MRSRVGRALVAVTVLAFLCAGARAETLAGRVVGVADGDTITVLVSGRQQRVIRRQNDGFKAFVRYALKMATGTGKTTVMGMLAATFAVFAEAIKRGAAPRALRWSQTPV